jgi:peptide/nickel transport system permease protein
MAQTIFQSLHDTTEVSLPVQSSNDSQTGNASSSPLVRVAKYTGARAIVLFVMVTIAVYLTILVANMGGFVDEIIKTNIEMSLMGLSQSGALRDMSVEEKFQYIEQARAAMIQAEGLNEPFMMRCFRWLGHGLTLNWGESERQRLIRGVPTRDVKKIILDGLPRTLLIFGTANLFLFFTTIFVALALTKKHGSWLDKIVVALSPMSSAPAWIYGIILNLVFLRLLGTSLTGAAFHAWPDEFKLVYLPTVLKQMFLPFVAIFLSGFFQSVYAWRAFFQLYASEDHVEMAKAKGLTPRVIERRYILRTALPSVITSFALLIIVLWQEIIPLELFFNVAGIGQLFWTALRQFDMPVILGLVVTFAYLLAITVFLLDVFYALVDPRVRVGSENGVAKSAYRKKKAGLIRFWPARKPASIQKHAWDPRPDLTPPIFARAGNAISGLPAVLGNSLNNLKGALREISDHPAAVLGLSVIVALLATSIATVIVIPYDKAVTLWRGDENVWYRNPLKAPPEWINYFRRKKLPETFVLDSHGGQGSPYSPANEVAMPSHGGVVSKTVTALSQGMTDVTISFSFDYPYDGFPQDLVVRFDATYHEKKPMLSLTWLTPDGREIDLGTFSIVSSQAYYVSQDSRLQRLLKTPFPQQALLADPAVATPVSLKGTYGLRISGLMFEENPDLDAEFVVYGQVYGLAGTDHQRRDLMVALLWGMPVALAFGLLAAVGTTISSVVIAGAGVWFGGGVDNLVQRITEVNMILPFIPVSIMIYTLYSKSFWMILGVTVLLSIFGKAIKNYRAIFLQVKEAPYIEAAQAYGAGNWRIVFRYLIPRIGTILVPQLVILVPTYVFLEATLAYLQVSDPLLPTWGKLIIDALQHGTYSGDYHMLLEPAGLLIMTGFAFAMVGFSLERIFEPRLRER